MAWKDMSGAQRGLALCMGAIAVWAMLGGTRKESPPSTPAAPPPTTALTLNSGSMNAKLAALTNSQKWQSVRFDKADGRSFRVYADYAAPPYSAAQVRADGEAVAKAALEAIKAGGVDPWQNSTFLSVYVQRQDGDIAGQPMIRRYGRVSFSAATGRFDFEEER